MANSKISGLTAATTPLAGTEEFVLFQSGNKKLTSSNFVATPGTWTTVAYSAGNFTASASMTWTVDAGDVVTYAYQIIGKIMFFNFYIAASSIGGTPHLACYIKIPASKTPKSSLMLSTNVIDNGAVKMGGCIITTNNSNIGLYCDLTQTTNWTASTNTTVVSGMLTFEIN